jgi:hypothetical protein
LKSSVNLRNAINKPTKQWDTLNGKEIGEVIFEGADVNTYKPVKSNFDLSSIKEDFAYLFVGHWMQGHIG